MNSLGRLVGGVYANIAGAQIRSTIYFSIFRWVQATGKAVENVGQSRTSEAQAKIAAVGNSQLAADLGAS